MSAIKKKIDIEVDSKQWTALLKSIKENDKLLKNILKTQQSSLNVTKKEIAERKKLNEEVKKQKDIEEEIKKIQEERAFQKRLREYENPEKSKLEKFFDWKDDLKNFKLSVRYKQAAEAAQKLSANKVEDYDNQISDEQLRYQEFVRTKGADSSEAKESKAKIDQLRIQRSKEIGTGKELAGKYQALARAAAGVEKVFATIKNIALSALHEFDKAIIKNIQDLLDFNSGIATFNTSNSLITNSAAREQQLKYGLSASQNYGFTKAKDMLNIQSDEDLMYMNAEQRGLLLSYMERFSRFYDEMESSGVLQDIQEMQLAFKELKQEIAMEFLQWVAENKEAIMNAIRGIFDFIKFIANLVIKIVNALSGPWGKKYEEIDSIATSSDQINNSSNNIKNTTININANTTNNATGVLGSPEALEKFSQENWSNLAKDIVSRIGG